MQLIRNDSRGQFTRAGPCDIEIEICRHMRRLSLEHPNQVEFVAHIDSAEAKNDTLSLARATTLRAARRTAVPASRLIVVTAKPRCL